MHSRNYANNGFYSRNHQNSLTVTDENFTWDLTEYFDTLPSDSKELAIKSAIQITPIALFMRCKGATMTVPAFVNRIWAVNLFTLHQLISNTFLIALE